ncbi:MAG: hypothetical protein GW772_08385 [Flavobacteriia bacterium]|nr:hypothetical protein [Flavobacteriia bacterium]OIP46344.1 MAG: hypothetical protein AUK46_08995 [Flavobacteriaceae bacterium CG2_30_31_66]PIV95710.1 MAG: hypothetical protein COW43_12190 [Flavobacteriaceae bacterium CG17_big_fil_post_rev_8_21_14_2_50_31_13]PIX12144.1 MAG: hypothetical protein COZ74_12115 [Flavobacteriaceae bacterium CG_4_8_14_3_um_filter_31_8]PIY15609.1 MAG: hypothetical protein COZ16_03615 [Flavobacteriaceae bacterium CG_4_10_14_3_um_filter_31_253]PIZ09280.1 MAG: hypotheti
MSTNQPQKSNDEEVDLGSLFVIIGRGFSKFFNFFGSIFKGLFHLIILFLIFVKENSVKIGIATLIGLIAGVFLEVTTPKKYASELLIEPNFKSSLQLYNNVNYYNDLVKQKDTLKLQETFNLTKEEAASLKKFTIEPVKNEKDIINAYDDLILSVDTLTIKSYEFVKFKAAFTNFDYKIHKVIVTAEKSDVFDKLDDVIISSVVKNKYFNRLKELTNENLNRTDSVYKENLSQIDSLRKVYMQVMLDEAKKVTSGTNIDLGGDKKTTKEIELFETGRKINIDLREIAKEKSNKYEVINVISNFQPVGYEIKGVTKNYVFQLGGLGAFIMIFFLLLVKLNNFLNHYKK